ncbi:MAG TPA: hypothetical protein VFQ60_03920 [Patescibacteria group bacterium]|nr:hypothetical protein [Patescibacteria group bacterium]
MNRKPYQLGQAFRAACELIALFSAIRDYLADDAPIRFAFVRELLQAIRKVTGRFPLEFRIPETSEPSEVWVSHPNEIQTRKEIIRQIESVLPFLHQFVERHISTPQTTAIYHAGSLVKAHAAFCLIERMVQSHAS